MKADSRTEYQTCQAHNLFADGSRVPARTTRAITEDFYSYRPNAANFNYGSNYIERRTGNILAASGQCEANNLADRMAEVNADIERLEMEVEGCKALISEAGHDEKLARDRVESDRKGLQEVNVEIQRCRAALEDLGGNDPAGEMQREMDRKEEEITKILASYAPLKLEIKKLKIAQENTELEFLRIEGDLTRARAKTDALPNLDLLKVDIERKRKLLESQQRTRTVLEREKEETKKKRDAKLSAAKKFRDDAREKANGEEIGEVRETEKELSAKRARVAQEKKKIIEEIGNLSFEQFQVRIKIVIS